MFYYTMENRSRERHGRPQGAAQNTGEAIEQFIERAVQTQAQRDKSSLGLGINPAPGDKMTREA